MRARLQVKDYNFSRPGYAEGTSHVSQMLWLEPRRAGCAANAACQLPTYICQYTPPGASCGGWEGE